VITREIYNDSRILLSRMLDKYFGEKLLPNEMAAFLEKVVERAYKAGRDSQRGPFDDEITGEHETPSAVLRKVRG